MEGKITMAASPKRTDINLEEFRKRLLEERARLVEDHRRNRGQMVEEAEDVTENELSAVTTMDTFENADTAAVLYDQERYEAQDENVRQMIYQIDHALERMEDGNYGLSEVSGEPIPVERLRALPWATMTVEEADRYQQ